MTHPYCLLVIALTCLLATHSLFAAEHSPSKPNGVSETSKPGARVEDAQIAAWWLEQIHNGSDKPEAAKMLIAIAQGSFMGPGEGWFGPSKCRYSWPWLAQKAGVSPEESLSADKFPGAKEWFALLDRDRNGQVNAADFDWSERYSQQAYAVNRWFRKLDRDGDGKLSREEWMQFFDHAARGQDAMTSDELSGVLAAAAGGSLGPGDRPTTEQLVRGLFNSEIGSLLEGPDLEAPAPDFTLRNLSDGKPVHLADFIGEKPIVLVFGNFTCGPFRSMVTGVNAVAERFKDEAHFLGVYVREAHPTDGWRMAANDSVGVAVPQPTTYEERCSVAGMCQKRLNLSFPLLVDEIDDRVGHAYSGMPARLYVIDKNGKVAYKAGRGPFGFKVGEMEQSLILCLLDAEQK
jgi:thiol-disulfide isomerase/thioredoxin